MKKINSQRGTVLLMLLVMVTLLGLAAGIAGTSWKTITQRAKEEELLWRGSQIRKAIGSYLSTGQVGAKTSFPEKLEDLVRDPRSLSVVRHLRKPYSDPMTGGDWVIIRDPGGRIRGVRSSSTLKPFKQQDFSEENKLFAGKQSYAEWEFVYDLQQTTKVKSQTAATGAASQN